MLVRNVLNIPNPEEFLSLPFVAAGVENHSKNKKLMYLHCPYNFEMLAYIFYFISRLLGKSKFAVAIKTAQVECQLLCSIFTQILFTAIH